MVRIDENGVKIVSTLDPATKRHNASNILDQIHLVFCERVSLTFNGALSVRRMPTAKHNETNGKRLKVLYVAWMIPFVLSPLSLDALRRQLNSFFGPVVHSQRVYTVHVYICSSAYHEYYALFDMSNVQQHNWPICYAQ